MPQMNNDKHIHSQQSRMRLVVFIFGASLTVFMIYFSGDKISASGRALLESGLQFTENDMAIDLQSSVGEVTIEDTRRKFKAHHNFIVSYLFQESSFERKNRNAETNTDFVSNIKQVHQLVFKHFPGIL
jgi:hypothetical protein